jgi:hypothetical protein
MSTYDVGYSKESFDEMREEISLSGRACDKQEVESADSVEHRLSPT